MSASRKSNIPNLEIQRKKIETELEFYRNQNDLQKLKEKLKEYANAGFEKNIYFYNLELDLECRNKNVRAIRAVFEKLKDSGLRPNIYTIITLYFGFSQANLPFMFPVIQEYSRSFNIDHLDVAFYNSYMDYCSNSNNIYELNKTIQVMATLKLNTLYGSFPLLLYSFPLSLFPPFLLSSFPPFPFPSPFYFFFHAFLFATFIPYTFPLFPLVIVCRLSINLQSMGPVP